MRVSQLCRDLVFKFGVYAALEPDALEIWLHDGSPPGDIDNDAYPNSWISKQETHVSSQMVTSADGSIIELQGKWGAASGGMTPGTATWFSIRRKTSYDDYHDYLGYVAIADGSVSGVGGGGDLELSSTVFASGDYAYIVSLFVEHVAAGIGVSAHGTIG